MQQKSVPGKRGKAARIGGKWPERRDGTDTKVVVVVVVVIVVVGGGGVGVVVGVGVP